MVTEASVLLADLENISEVVHTAASFHQAQDLTEGYRKLNARMRPSALTAALQGIAGKLDAYIVRAQEEEETDE